MQRHTYLIVRPLYRGADWLEDDLSRSLDDLASEIDDFLQPIRSRFDDAASYQLLVKDGFGRIQLAPVDRLATFNKSQLFDNDGYLQLVVISRELDWNHSLLKASLAISDEFSVVGEIDGHVVWTFYENGEYSDGYFQARECGHAPDMESCANRPEHLSAMAILKKLHEGANATAEFKSKTPGKSSESLANFNSAFAKSVFNISVISASLAFIVLIYGLDFLPKQLESFFEDLALIVLFLALSVGALTYLSVRIEFIGNIAGPVVDLIERLSAPPESNKDPREDTQSHLMQSIRRYAVICLALTFALISLAPMLIGSRWGYKISDAIYLIFLVAFWVLVVGILFDVSDPINKFIRNILVLALSMAKKFQYLVKSSDGLERNSSAEADPVAVIRAPNDRIFELTDDVSETTDYLIENSTVGTFQEIYVFQHNDSRSIALRRNYKSGRLVVSALSRDLVLKLKAAVVDQRFDGREIPHELDRCWGYLSQNWVDPWDEAAWARERLKVPTGDAVSYLEENLKFKLEKVYYAINGPLQVIKKHQHTSASYTLEYDRPQNACLIRWIDKNHKIEDCKPLIDFIRCDDGTEYKFLRAREGEIASQSVAMFKPVKIQTSNEVESSDYYLCFSAYFEIKTLDTAQEFIRALAISNNQVEVVLQFNDHSGNRLEGCYEELESRSTALSKI